MPDDVQHRLSGENVDDLLQTPPVNNAMYAQDVTSWGLIPGPRRHPSRKQKDGQNI